MPNEYTCVIKEKHHHVLSEHSIIEWFYPGCNCVCYLVPCSSRCRNVFMALVMAPGRSVLMEWPQRGIRSTCTQLGSTDFSNAAPDASITWSQENRGNNSLILSLKSQLSPTMPKQRHWATNMPWQAR